MASLPAGPEIERLVQLLAKLPGLGPRSARRAALTLLKKRESLLDPLATAMAGAAAAIRQCSECGNLDTTDPCSLCRDPRREAGVLCVVEDVADLWALERAGVFKGRYHVLGGALSALDGITPDKLNLGMLIERVKGGIGEIILAMNATVEGQTTAHYLLDALEPLGVKITRLAHGVPVGGELDYLDEGTLSAAFKARPSRRLGPAAFDLVGTLPPLGLLGSADLSQRPRGRDPNCLDGCRRRGRPAMRSGRAHVWPFGSSENAHTVRHRSTQKVRT